MPSKFSKKDVFEVGIRAKTLEGENKQLMLKLQNDIPSKGLNFDMDFMMVLKIFGGLVLLIILVFVIKSVKKKWRKY